MCPLCNKSEYISIGKPRVNTTINVPLRKDYSIVKCLNCNFYSVNPEIDFNQQEWQMLYNSEYFPPMTQWHKKKRDRDLRLRLNNLQKYTSNKKKKFLDIGSGEGYSLIKGRNYGWEVFGIDISDLRIEQAKQKDIIFFISDLISVKFPDSYFDCIYIDSVLEHVPNPMQLLIEIKRILKIGGCVYIGVPNEDSLFTRVLGGLFKISGRRFESARLKPFVSPFHIGGFNKSSLKFALESCGFSIIKFRNFASKSEIMNVRFFSREFFIALLYLPISILAVPLRMELYLEVYLTKVK
jgi:SAM-dependent methyltransferase